MMYSRWETYIFEGRDAEEATAALNAWCKAWDESRRLIHYTDGRQTFFISHQRLTPERYEIHFTGLFATNDRNSGWLS